MKEISELHFPDDTRFSESHEWARRSGETVRVGISDYAQDQLGDIVFVELPQPGEVFGKGDEFGTVESVKAVSELFMPISGEVAAINTALEDAPEQVNESPYDGGWMIEITPEDPAEYDGLLDKEAYVAKLKG
jgi:glycine cleavage system H protein